MAREIGEILHEEEVSGYLSDGTPISGHIVFCNECLKCFDTAPNLRNHRKAAHAWNGEDVNLVRRPELVR